jgi:hypothetical protein
VRSRSHLAGPVEGVRARVLLATAVPALVATASAPALQARPSLPHSTVVLQSLDKVTARVGAIEARVGDVTRVGSLAVIPHACFTSPPTEAPESAAFLEIREVGDDGSGGEVVFSGWMFASTPGLSALEHAVYDVWVLRCEDPVEQAPEPLSPSTTQSPNG